MLELTYRIKDPYFLYKGQNRNWTGRLKNKSPFLFLGIALYAPVTQVKGTSIPLFLLPLSFQYLSSTNPASFSSTFFSTSAAFLQSPFSVPSSSSRPPSSVRTMSGVAPVFQGQLAQSLVHLRAMGFNEPLSQQALFLSNFDLNNAVTYLLSQAGDEDPVARARPQPTTPATLRVPPREPDAHRSLRARPQAHLPLTECHDNALGSYQGTRA